MQNEDIIKKRKRGGNIGGLILIIIGAGLLLQRMDLDIPDWVFSWQSILIVVGLAIGINHRFKSGGWMIITAVGVVFLVGDIMNWPYNTARFIWPLGLIIAGLILIIKRKDWDTKKERYKHKYPYEKYAQQYQDQYSQNQYYGQNHTTSTEDFIDSNVMFGGENKIILSKNFKGGRITAFCGGSEINLMKADFTGTVVLDVSAIFGGIEVIVPGNWNVKVEVTSIMGGVEDKRSIEFLEAANPDKTLIIRGSATFGGVEIKSYA